MNTITCPKCGTENPDSAMNCRQCGINLKYALEHPEEFMDTKPQEQELSQSATQSMNKMEIAAEIGRLERELSKIESELREHERQLSSVKGNRTAGAAALLVGLLGILFFIPLWPLWGFLVLIGIPTFITAISKQSKLKQEITSIEKRIADTRAKLAERRAQLAAF